MRTMIFASKGLRGGRAGFTMLELILVVFISGILLSSVLPRFTEGRRHAHVDRATRVVAMDLRLASTLASRQRRPVEIDYDADGMSLTISDQQDGTVYHTRRLGADSDFRLSSLAFSVSPLEVAPSGLASSGLAITLSSGSYTRQVTMLRGGVVRVVPR